MDRQIDCPNCNNWHTFPTPESEFERFCPPCGHVWDIRSIEEINAE